MKAAEILADSAFTAAADAMTSEAAAAAADAAALTSVVGVNRINRAPAASYLST